MKRIKQDLKQRTLTQEAWMRFKQNKLAMIGLIVIAAMLLISIATFALDILGNEAIYKDYVVKQSLLDKLAKPSVEHPLGCDEYGRDILFRLLWGTRYSLFAGVLTILLAITVGGILGSIAGYYGGRVDNIIMRIMDMVMTIPSIVLALAIVAALGTEKFSNIIVALSVAHVPRFARVVRSSVMTVKGSDYIEAARAVGASDGTIILRYVMPNALSPVIVQGTLGVATTILDVTGMSFLGLGVQPPVPEWGSILSSARIYMRDAWHISIFPGLAIVLCILCLNLLGDGLRDALDPKLKK